MTFERPATELQLLYDRQCPFCEFYCRRLKVEPGVGALEIIDAREQSPLMEEVTARGLDIDEGMVLKVGDQFYYGTDAIHALALIEHRKGIFNRLNYHLFRFKPVARVLYPVFRFLRNRLLHMMGRKRINNLARRNNEFF